MPREESRLPRSVERKTGARTQRDTLDEVWRQRDRFLSRYDGGTTGEVVEVTETFEDENGVIYTRHPFILGVDTLGDPLARLWVKGN